MSIQVFGLPVSRGVAIGRAVLVASSRVDVAHYYVEAAMIDAEVRRLGAARDLVVQELTALKGDVPEDAHDELVALLDVHLMLLQDDSLSEATRQWIVERHYNAEWALSSQLEVIARQFDEMEDEYLRDRKADLEQVVERVITALGRLGGDSFDNPPPQGQRDFAGEDPLVLVANDIAPADMLKFRRSVFTGFVTDVGGRNSHTAIVARSMDIPAVVGAREASRIVTQDDWIIIDGDAGVVIVNPSPIVLEEYRFRQRQVELERARLDRLRHTPAVTLDGHPIELLANIELPSDAQAVLDAGAVGVGLFRSEFLFMNRAGRLPGEEEQYEAYSKVVKALAGLPVTIRTVDIGADKQLDRTPQQMERVDHNLNPALGLRAIRWSLSEPEMFGEQLRAILRASVHGKVRLLVPMVAQLREVRLLIEAIERAKAQLRARAQAYVDVAIGAMIEVPAAALMLPSLLKYFDFVSIGTNDLIQYTLAIDRADEAVSHLYDPWHPAVLRLIAQTIAKAQELGKEVSVCGEMAGDPAFTELLLGMGLRSFSMHPTQVSSIKKRILRVDSSVWNKHIDLICEADDPQVTYGRLQTAVPGHVGG
ncbi:phosphoenolpyruvate--protein phosphotransferase [Scleromatobacter humisilvae]|uniref:Phosphoenolpyruvate-protein phosphotransferase n=1 Tax=Scleromatobacter humisilvae TaxID=2897159 RepID=A0A9X1YL76_9BURK|nr:phosphoenolpyruvate--protein phosphotransferase [Scleromatobacter humisilvae]MCK9687777.1 phosphoenolpyruvate--protein phosphotransferase [Scleromatobacter humisilvae]